MPLPDLRFCLTADVRYCEAANEARQNLDQATTEAMPWNLPISLFPAIPVKFAVSKWFTLSRFRLRRIVAAALVLHRTMNMCTLYSVHTTVLYVHTTHYSTVCSHYTLQYCMFTLHTTVLYVHITVHNNNIWEIVRLPTAL